MELNIRRRKVPLKYVLSFFGGRNLKKCMTRKNSRTTILMPKAG